MKKRLCRKGLCGWLALSMVTTGMGGMTVLHAEEVQAEEAAAVTADIYPKPQSETYLSEEGISLGKLQSGKVITCNGLGTHHVQAREEPATPGGLLVGDAFGLHPDGKMRVDAFLFVQVERELADVIAGNRIADSLVGGRLLVRLLDFLQHLLMDTALLLSLQGQQRRAE